MKEKGKSGRKNKKKKKKKTPQVSVTPSGRPILMNWMNLHLTYQLAAGHMTDELAFKGYSPQATPQPPPPPSHTGFTLGWVSSPPRPRGGGGLPWTPGTGERAGVCDAGATFSKGASELRLVVVSPDNPTPPPHGNLFFQSSIFIMTFSEISAWRWRSAQIITRTTTMGRSHNCKTNF